MCSFILGHITWNGIMLHCLEQAAKGNGLPIHLERLEGRTRRFGSCMAWRSFRLGVHQSISSDFPIFVWSGNFCDTNLRSFWKSVDLLVLRERADWQTTHMCRHAHVGGLSVISSPPVVANFESLPLYLATFQMKEICMGQKSNSAARKLQSVHPYFKPPTRLQIWPNLLADG